MKNRMKRIIALIIAIITVASLMVACQGNGNKNTVESRRSTTQPDKDRYGRKWVSDSIPDDAYYADENLNAESVRIFTRDNTASSGTGNDAQYLLLEFKGNESANAVMQDAVLARNEEVENRLGITLDIVAEPGQIDNSDQWLNKLMAAALNENGNDLFDIAAIYASQGSALATRGCFLDVNLLPEGTIDLDKVWWNRTLQDELEIDGALFMLGGDISLSSSAFAHAIFFNKNMFAEYFSKDESFQNEYDYVSYDPEEGVTLYDIVNDDAWSISVLHDLASKIYVDGGNPGKDENDTYGMVIDQSSSPLDAWVAALNIQFISKNTSTGEVKLAFSEVDGALDHANRAYRKVSDLLSANSGVYAYKGEEGAIKKFANGDAMFIMCRLCDAENFRNTGDWEYGILPLPKYESGVGEYYTLPHNSYSLIVVAANLDDSRAEMVGYTLELLAAESYRQVTPAYYNTVLKSDYSDRPEDADMYDLVIKNIKMDFATIFSTKSLEGITNPIRMGGLSFSESWQTYHGKYEDALETLVAGLKEQAQKQRDFAN